MGCLLIEPVLVVLKVFFSSVQHPFRFQYYIFLHACRQGQLCYTTVAVAAQAGSDGTSAQVEQAARGVSTNSKHGVVEVFMSLRGQGDR